MGWILFFKAVHANNVKNLIVHFVINLVHLTFAHKVSKFGTVIKFQCYMNSNINTQSLVYHTARKPSLLTKLHLKFSLSRQQSKIVSKYQRKNTWVPGK